MDKFHISHDLLHIFDSVVNNDDGVVDVVPVTELAVLLVEVLLCILFGLTRYNTYLIAI